MLRNSGPLEVSGQGFVEDTVGPWRALSRSTRGQPKCPDTAKGWSLGHALTTWDIGTGPQAQGPPSRACKTVPQSWPGKPVAHTWGLLSENYGLL